MNKRHRWFARAEEKGYAKGIVRDKKVSLSYEPFTEHPLQKRETMCEPPMLARNIFN
jgi:hypothetical protein